MKIKELMRIYNTIKEPIKKQIASFKQRIIYGSEEDLFAELAFCLLTPQSKAKTCWRAIEYLRENGTLFNGNNEQILVKLRGIRFKYKKSMYIVEARKLFSNNENLRIRNKLTQFKDTLELRRWLVKNVRGFGYKEASHFLRNVGISEELAILDRHILKNLVRLNVINQLPTSISTKRYIEIEKKMQSFANRIGIPISHLDLLLWYKETGEIFK